MKRKPLIKKQYLLYILIFLVAFECVVLISILVSLQPTWTLTPILEEELREVVSINIAGISTWTAFCVWDYYHPNWRQYKFKRIKP
jgi:hypothetical protein